MQWLVVRCIIPCIMIFLCILSINLWNYSPYWAALTAVLTACTASYSIFCWWLDPEKCDVKSPEG